MCFNKILIANRGEIALRIIKTARKLRIKTYVLYMSIDESSDYVRSADFSILLEGSSLSDTFLNIVQKIICLQKNVL